MNEDLQKETNEETPDVPQESTEQNNDSVEGTEDVTKSEDEVIEQNPGSKRIEVEEDKLDKLITAFEDQKSIIKEQGEEIEILKGAVKKNALAASRESRKDPEYPKCYLKVYAKQVTPEETDDEGNVTNEATYKNSLIVGWKSSPENKIVYNQSTGMPVGEILKARYYLHDGGDTGWIDQVQVTRINDLAFFNILSRDKDGYLTLRAVDLDKWGEEELKIHESFVNP